MQGNQNHNSVSSLKTVGDYSSSDIKEVPEIEVLC